MASSLFSFHLCYNRIIWESPNDITLRTILVTRKRRKTGEDDDLEENITGKASELQRFDKEQFHSLLNVE